MDNKKFEQLIDLVINENEEQARALFHDIVVENSREIYENMMHDEMDEGMDGIGGQVGQMMDEISAEEEGMTEEEDEVVDFDDEDDEDIVDIETDDDMGGDEGVEERLVSIEDKLDQLMAEFEEIMGNEDEMGGDESDAEFDVLAGCRSDGRHQRQHDLQSWRWRASARGLGFAVVPTACAWRLCRWRSAIRSGLF